MADHLSRQQAEITAWHEIVHMLMWTGGRKRPKNDLERQTLEEESEAAAVKLAKCCPEIIEMLGITEQYPKGKS